MEKAYGCSYITLHQRNGNVVYVRFDVVGAIMSIGDGCTVVMTTKKELGNFTVRESPEKILDALNRANGLA